LFSPLNGGTVSFAIAPQVGHPIHAMAKGLPPNERFGMSEVTQLVQALSQRRNASRAQAQDNSTKIVTSFLDADRPKSALLVAIVHSPFALRLAIVAGIIAAAWVRTH
jgi:hypothetical protein